MHRLVMFFWGCRLAEGRVVMVLPDLCIKYGDGSYRDPEGLRAIANASNLECECVASGYERIVLIGCSSCLSDQFVDALHSFQPVEVSCWRHSIITFAHQMACAES